MGIVNPAKEGQGPPWLSELLKPFCHQLVLVVLQHWIVSNFMRTRTWPRFYFFHCRFSWLSGNRTDCSWLCCVLFQQVGVVLLSSQRWSQVYHVVERYGMVDFTLSQRVKKSHRFYFCFPTFLTPFRPFSDFSGPFWGLFPTLSGHTKHFPTTKSLFSPP